MPEGELGPASVSAIKPQTNDLSYIAIEIGQPSLRANRRHKPDPAICRGVRPTGDGGGGASNAYP